MSFFNAQNFSCAPSSASISCQGICVIGTISLEIAHAHNAGGSIAVMSIFFFGATTNGSAVSAYTFGNQYLSNSC